MSIGTNVTVKMFRCPTVSVGKRQRVGQPDDQAERRLDRPAGFIVPVYENQRA